MKKTTFTLCLSFFCTFVFSQFQYHWGNQFVSSSTAFGSSTYAYFIDTETDVNGNIYAAGNFVETVDIDPGPGVQNITAAGGNYYSSMLVKFNSNGELIWAHTFVGSNVESLCTGIEMDSESNLYLVMETPGVIDLDPGPGTTHIGATGNVTVSTSIAKYDTTGAFIDHMEITRPYSLSAFNQLPSLYISEVDSVYLLKSFGATMDVDPGPGTTQLQPSSPAWFSASYDKSFAFGSAFMVQAPNWVRSYNQVVDAQGNRYLSFLAYDNVDIAPGPGVFLVSAPTYNFGINEGDVIAVKYSADGTPLSMIQIQEASDVTFVQKHAGGFLLTGIFSANTDFDPAGGLQNTFVGRPQTGFLASYDDAFALEWVGLFNHEANGFSRPTSLIEQPSGEIVAGVLISPDTDLDPTGGFVAEPLTNSAPFGATAIIQLSQSGGYVGHAVYDDPGVRNHYCNLFQGPDSSLLYLSTYQDTVDMDPGIGTDLAPYSGNGVGGFIIKLDYSGSVGTDPIMVAGERWQAWPIPTDQEMWVRFELPVTVPSRVRILNMMGVELRRRVVEVGGSSLHLDLEKLPSGMYLLEVQMGSHITGKRVLVY